jgi:hypothetical protein
LKEGPGLKPHNFAAFFHRAKALRLIPKGKDNGKGMPDNCDALAKAKVDLLED